MSRYRFVSGKGNQYIGLVMFYCLFPPQSCTTHILLKLFMFFTILFIYLPMQQYTQYQYFIYDMATVTPNVSNF